MNAQELETAKREEINFVTLIFRDNEYGLISMKQKEKFGTAEMTGFSNPDFRMMAESMGLKGYSITSAADLKPVLEEAFSLSVPAVIDCPVVY